MTLPTIGATGQRQPTSVQYKVAACATAPVAPSTDFTAIGSNINQREFSGKQDGAFAISKNTTSGNLTLMMATGLERDDTWIPMTRAATLTPAAVAALSFSTNLAATQSVAAGADATFTVVVAGGHAPYTYKWYWNDVYIDPNADPANPNPTASTASLVNHAVTSASAGKYKVVVTDLSGKVITSAECTLTVT